MLLFSAGLWVHAMVLMLRVQGSGGSFPKPLSATEEAACLQAMAQGDMQARDKLTLHNLRLVAHIVKKYYATSCEQDDLISIGTIGLIKAVNTYKTDKAVKLATYAARCIENEILMHFRAGKRTQNEVSLTQDSDSEDGSALRLLDMLSVEDERLHIVEMHDSYQKMYACLSQCLDAREQEVIILRYGLGGQEPLTQKEVAARKGISRSYVSRLESKALGKMRTVLEKEV